MVSVIIGLAKYLDDHYSTIYSIEFIKGHTVVYSVISIWLNNESSFLLGEVLVILHNLKACINTLLKIRVGGPAPTRLSE